MTTVVQEVAIVFDDPNEVTWETIRQVAGELNIPSDARMRAGTRAVAEEDVDNPQPLWNVYFTWETDIEDVLNPPMSDRYTKTYTPEGWA